MKLRKQAPAKAFIVAAAGVLLVTFLALIRANPRIEAEAQPTAPPPDFDRFFVPQAPPATQPQPVVTPRPHTRTRAS